MPSVTKERSGPRPGDYNGRRHRCRITGPQRSLCRRIGPNTRIGHVHLKVADIERALAFYCGVLGFELTQRYGAQAAFVSAGGYHHHIGLNTWRARADHRRPLGQPGSTTSRSSIPRARRSLMRSGALWKRAFRSWSE